MYMLKLERLGELGRGIGNWVETHPLPEPETGPMFTSFYPPRMGDPFEVLSLRDALAASMARSRPKQEGQDGGSVDTGQSSG